MGREELHRRMEMLNIRLSRGRLYIAPHLTKDFQQGLLKVRLCADGMVDPDSVDDRIQSILAFIPYQGERDEWNEIVSLRKIQQAYFHQLEGTFGPFHREMTEAGLNPHSFSGRFVCDPRRVRDGIHTASEFVSGILQFWRHIPEATWVHLKESLERKAVFFCEDFSDGFLGHRVSAEKHFDITVMPDPFVRRAADLRDMEDGERCQEVLRSALQVLSYRDLALPDTETPVVAVLADHAQ